ncbi:hypothetical protein F2Q69_00055832 [Brassica cretica]|uniref:Uncharacterized protein n=1 Tax=Brassica cretica TaxID=69181 RepID=A0A8S9MPP5_BRACR|nr:hypothetical protein F2Q69_00055832 [Brassica cretica]
MAQHDVVAQEETSVIKPLVTLLLLDLFELRAESAVTVPSDIGGSGSVRTRKERRDNENPEVKHELKINCAEALWMLARGNIASPMDAGFTLLNERTLDVHR